MTSDATVIAEAIGYGVDVEPGRCDVSLLRQDVAILRATSPDVRAELVARLNEGFPLSARARGVRKLGHASASITRPLRTR